MKIENPRMARGLAILKDESAVQRIEERHNRYKFQVKSQSGEGYYTVTKQHNLWGCECPDHINRKVYCKHIYAVQYQLKMKKLVRDEVKPKPVDSTFKPFCCPQCKGNNIKKNGTRDNKRGVIQRFKCLDCNHRFIIDKGFNNMKNDPHCVLASVDLYFKGLSYRKISDHLSQFYNIKVSQTTPMRWVKKYLKMLGEYANEHQPEVGMMWHSDEMKVKVKGEWQWIWNVMDNETRFLLACKITEGRSVKEAKIPIREAKERAGKRPDMFITDGLQSYPEAIRRTFGLGDNYAQKNRHHRYRDFQTAPNNNIVERLNGTVRERLKVMRGLENVPSTEDFLKGIQVYYNYIRPHSAIGTTPALASNIDLNIEDNRWAGMVELIANQKQFGGN